MNFKRMLNSGNCYLSSQSFEILFNLVEGWMLATTANISAKYLKNYASRPKRTIGLGVNAIL